MGLSIRKQLILALGSALMLSTTVVPSAQAATSLVELFNQHTNTYDRFKTLRVDMPGGGFQEVKYYGCPTSLPILPANALNKERAINQVKEDLNNCKESIQNLTAAVESQSWSVDMDRAAGLNIIVGSLRQNPETNYWTPKREYIVGKIADRKQDEYLARIENSRWSESLEDQASLIRPFLAYEYRFRANNALKQPRHDELTRRAGNDEWSVAWEKQLWAQPIARYVPSDTQSIITRRFRQFVTKLKIDTTPWSPDFEKQVYQAIAGANDAQRTEVSNRLESKRRALTREFDSDGQLWSPEWDRRISPLAQRESNANRIQARRRQAFVHDIATQQPWEAVLDRQLKAFVADSASGRVPLSRETIAAINAWRSQSIVGPLDPSDNTDVNQTEGTGNPSHPGNTPSHPGNTSWSFENLSSTAGIEKVFGIILALLTGIGAVLSALLPLAKRILPIIQRR